MEQKQFCLKWDNYLDVFHGALLPLLNSEHFTDVTLSCDSQSIKCHRLVLSSFSSYFETLLLEISHPHPVIILKDVKFHDLLALVNFMYTGEVTVPQAQTSPLIKVAEMLKVKGLAYPDETVNQILKPSCLAQNTQMTQPAVKRNRVDTTFQDNFLAGESCSNLECPVADTSNDKLVNYPAEDSSSVYQTDIAACNPLLVKDEFAVGIDKGWDNSTSQFEVDGEHFDNDNERLIGNQIMERTERKPEVEEPFPDFSEDIFGRKYPILSPKHEDVSLVVSPGVSEQLSRNFKPSELESNIGERVAGTSPSNTNTAMETSNSNTGLNSEKCRKDYECNICNKRFHFHSKLERHQRIHTEKETYKCDVCQNSFFSKYSLNRHQRHTEQCRKYYVCNICDKRFEFYSQLEMHKRIHPTFKCNICRKSFSPTDYTVFDDEYQTLQKPYKCHLCE